ncbi:hypothetical protein BBBOND_0208580 [Babesia bigemina]|uniref:Uncharacterized protein n=1 Tax=Babesia bigemina TaxID=5866 RepID=A0A061D9W2_BABBI|nr:hypothetical protein BBBOND_0208580 [Babesia bigemina]CDR95704.1 hypothetical protein BBBOND_0208580 [Babesia bigemina]|eukprot:XP_012767890.1 hypothetical protein BBBOND_0208580 [Babesia bigemina]
MKDVDGAVKTAKNKATEVCEKLNVSHTVSNNFVEIVKAIDKFNEVHRELIDVEDTMKCVFGVYDNTTKIFHNDIYISMN